MLIMFLGTALLASLLSYGAVLWSIIIQDTPKSKPSASLSRIPGPGIFGDNDSRLCNGHHDELRGELMWDRCFEITKGLLNTPDFASNGKSFNDKAPWIENPFERICIFVIDALRFDWLSWQPQYAAWFSNDTESYKLGRGFDFCIPGAKRYCNNKGRQPRAGINGFPIVHNLLAHPEVGKNSHIFRVLADMPTMTVQRVGGLMQGNIPPLFDLSKLMPDFRPSHADSMIHQLLLQNKTSVALGDGVWKILFPDGITTHIGLVSCDMSDVDSVDELIHQHLWKTLEMRTSNFTPKVVTNQYGKISSNWTFLVAHALGSDHIGHANSLDTTMMRHRYSIYDRIIANLLHYLTDGAVGKPYYSQGLPTIENWNSSLPALTDIHRETVLLEGDDLPKFSDILDLDRSTEMWDDTFLIVMGDHGVTDSGSHGGSHKTEVEAGLFYWSPLGLIDILEFSDSESLTETMFSGTTGPLTDPVDPLKMTDYRTSEYYQSHGYSFTSIDQLDLTPTWSIMLGLPMPAGTTGNIALQMLPLYASWKKSTRRGEQGIPMFDCGKNAHVIWPYSENRTIECLLMWGEYHNQTENNGKYSFAFPRNEVRNYRISRLSWIEHLAYLIKVHNILAWQLAERILAGGGNPQVEDELSDLWEKLQNNYSELTQPLDLDLLAAYLNHESAKLYIKRLESIIADYRRYIQTAQTYMRRIEETKFKLTTAKWIGMVPMIIITGLLAASLIYEIEKIPPFSAIETVAYFAPFIIGGGLFLILSKTFLNFESLLPKILGVGIYGLLFRMIIDFKQSKRRVEKVEVPLTNWHGGLLALNSDFLADKFFDRLSKQSKESEKWRQKLDDRVRVCMSLIISRLHWFIFIWLVINQMAYSVAVEFPDHFVRFLLQLLNFIFAARYLAITTRPEKIKIFDFTKVLLMWSSVIISVRFSYMFDPAVTSPVSTWTPYKIVIEDPEFATYSVIATLSVLLYAVNPICNLDGSIADIKQMKSVFQNNKSSKRLRRSLSDTNQVATTNRSAYKPSRSTPTWARVLSGGLWTLQALGTVIYFFMINPKKMLLVVYILRLKLILPRVLWGIGLSHIFLTIALFSPRDLPLGLLGNLYFGMIILMNTREVLSFTFQLGILIVLLKLMTFSATLHRNSDLKIASAGELLIQQIEKSKAGVSSTQPKSLTTLIFSDEEMVITLFVFA